MDAVENLICNTLYELWKCHPQDRPGFLREVNRMADEMKMPPDVRQSFLRLAEGIFDEMSKPA